ncbi:hypothetical protein QFC19_008651 [Naganishia cerealis]|uniref:Uncharacterized protein n=1 Tax=Naganishia cerealis TaxID=610337 RepID=A0ACC2V0K2_9TREE|nr:hypothetical protein QFC19_008651 [Naganishia cerealis]
MSTNAEVLEEELEVLESIFPDELEKYPETLPNLRLEPIDCELTGDEIDELLHGMAAVGTESLGMAMVFTMVSYLKEHLVQMLEARNRRQREEEDRRYAEMEEKEAARKRGTPVTPESFTALMNRLKQKALDAKKKAEEDRVKALPPKEREEYKKVLLRPTGELKNVCSTAQVLSNKPLMDGVAGRQLFETGKAGTASDEPFEEEGVEEVDFSKYSREERERARLETEEEQQQGGGVKFYDSD